ncbi:MAG: thioredoxin domain-containing protein [Gemmatimonadaceae bacterium]
MRPFYVGLGVVAVLGIAAIGWQSRKPKAAARIAAATPAQAEGYLYGAPTAPLTILEFADFECPACETFATVTEADVRKRIVDAGLANFRFFDFPLDQHRHTMQASNAAACANDQGKFWPMHDRLFAGQPNWASARNPKGTFREYAKEVGVELGAWDACYEASRHQGRILANRAEGLRRGVGSTPTFVIGRRVVPGALSYDVIKAYVDTALAEMRTSAPAVTPPDTGRPPAAAPRR